MDKKFFDELENDVKEILDKVNDGKTNLRYSSFEKKSRSY